MLTFFRYIYYSLYLVAIKLGFKDAKNAAKEYSGVGRGLIYTVLLLFYILTTGNFDTSVKGWPLFLAFILIEILIHWLLYSFKTHEEIELGYKRIPSFVAKCFTM